MPNFGCAYKTLRQKLAMLEKKESRHHRPYPCNTPYCPFVTASQISYAFIPTIASSSAVEVVIYPFNVSTSRCDSPSISKILIVLSEEQVASRRP